MLIQACESYIAYWSNQLPKIGSFIIGSYSSARASIYVPFRPRKRRISLQNAFSSTVFENHQKSQQKFKSPKFAYLAPRNVNLLASLAM